MSDTAAVLRPTPYRLVPLPPGRRRGDLLGEGGLSLLLHLLVLAALLLLVQERLPRQPAAPSEVALVFEGAPASANRSVPESQLSRPSTPPDRQATEPRQAPPAASAPPPVLPIAPPTESHLTTLLRPPRHAVPRSASRGLSSSLAAPMDFSLNGAPPPTSEGRLARGINLAMAPTAQNSDIRTRYAEASQALGADWDAELRQFVEEHKFYPESAAQKGEDGEATLNLTVARDGTVLAVSIAQSSGSPRLDAAWISVFRGNRVPPFPPGTTQDRVSFRYLMDFVLEYR